MKVITAVFLGLCFAGYAFSQMMPSGADPVLWKKALQIHKRAIVIDGHNDITSPMVDEDLDLGTDTRGKFHRDGDPYHTDIKRLRDGGVTGEFFSIYVSGAAYRGGGGMRRAMDLIDATYREVERHPDALSMCTRAEDIRRAKRAGKICALMGIEGGYAIENSLSALRDFYRLGIRYMTLTHNVSHDWADAHNDKPKNNGLSDFGKEVVREMNRLGMFVDISHVSEKVMNDVLDVSTAPIIASHSSARGVNDHTRNVSDAVLKRVAKNGGVIMINFYPSFLDARTNREENERDARLKPQLEMLRAKFKDDPAGFLAAQRKLYAENPIYIAPYTVIVDHIDHIKKVTGTVDNIGIGSDFDGVPFLPAGMRGVEDLPLVTYEMLRRGYTEIEIRKVLGGNFLRAMTQMERVAGSRRISGDGSLKKLAPPKIGQ
ncbi:MAG: membrane dipeptidase [Chloracidobacterium sp.]|nr:membrane dipeptidase [Chloracidobacterium sp.]MCO5334260.1 dipeptidase [Pyrinomonadaceae bacterium]